MRANSDRDWPRAAQTAFTSVGIDVRESFGLRSPRRATPAYRSFGSPRNSDGQ